MILMNAVRRVDPNFCILKEAKREVLEDLMDIGNARKIVEMIEEKKIVIEEIKPVARLGGFSYGRITGIYRIPVPEV